MLLMFIINKLAWKFYWYSSIWWFDIPMHFLGGVWLGLFFLYLFSRLNFVKSRILLTIFGVLVVGILWEFFETHLNEISKDEFNILDTVSDVLFDLAGGLCAIFYFLKRVFVKEIDKV